MFYNTINKIKGYSFNTLNPNIFFILLLYNISFLQSATISGKATDKKTEEALIGANIYIEINDEILGSATDIEGFYRIEDIPEGSYNIKASYLGYEAYTEAFEVDDINKEYNFDIKLNQSSIKVKEVIVKDEKRKEKKTEAPASKEIISSRDIRRSSTTNLGGYLKGLKGVDFTSSGINNYSISIRGFNSSFSSRLLLLTDGRVANIPALRVINFSTIPQSSEDVDKIEVVLGPATALYGANAHSGVINIISKPPSSSEGFNVSYSGTNDDRQLQKLNTRIAKKFGDFSFKISGEYVHANEWPYISELEYKLHRYPWSGHPERTIDGKDNNPWKGDIPASGGDIEINAETGINIYGNTVAIGDGEPNHGDLDGDGLAGEDWYNGYDDDGDATDSDGDGFCDGQELQWAIENGTEDQEAWNNSADFPSEQIEDFSNWIDEDYFYADGIDNDGDWDGDPLTTFLGIDENIDTGYDGWWDGVDNDGSGAIDDVEERRDDPGTPYGNWGMWLESGVLIPNGRMAGEYINGYLNPTYNEADFELGYWDGVDPHIRGDVQYNEDLFYIEFDVFIYDFGDDGIPGDPWNDLAGNDGEFDIGEPLLFGGWSDNGLDGIPGTGDDGEGDGIWQPGDSWVDVDGNGIQNFLIDDYISCYDSNGDGFCWGEQSYTEDDFNDVWPPANGIWDADWYGQNEEIYDYGQDGYQWDPNDEGWVIGEPNQALNLDGSYAVDYTGTPIIIYGPDLGENDGLYLAFDSHENDEILDAGDGTYEYPNFLPEFSITNDINADGISDYPDFEVENKKTEVRIDYDPHPDFNLTFQTGYSWTKTQQVTGIGRYMAEGWESTYYQLRGRYKGWFGQTFYSKSNSGKTRNYNIGSLINDQSSNLGVQIQHEFFMPKINTDITWGFDYSKTMPKTFGTILNDGPNGYDNDGDNALLQNDGIDNNGDGLIDDDYDGTDEPDEYFSVEANEFGFYFQTKTDLLGNEKWELIAAARLDHHDQLDEGLQFGPKVGINYSPNELSTWRLTYGMAYNTPSITTLYTELYFGKQAIFDIFLRGNKDGTPYARIPRNVDEYYYVDGVPYSYNINPLGPGYWNSDTGEFIPPPSFSEIIDDEYASRVLGAPFFFNTGDYGPNDYIPLDTSRHYIFVPFANDEGGVTYTNAESFNIPDVDPLGPEMMQTLEFGYKGFVAPKTFVAADLYISQFDDFFSPATIITPLIKRKSDDAIVGILPATIYGSNPPYGTAWDGIDNDNDWYGCGEDIECDRDFYTQFFIDIDDCNGNCNNYIEDPYDNDGNIINTSGVNMPWSEAFGWNQDANGNPNLDSGENPGEFGYVEFVFFPSEDGEMPEILGYTIYSPQEILDNYWQVRSEFQSALGNRKSYLGIWDVGVDEWSNVTGLNEAERIALGLVGPDGVERYGLGRPTIPPNIILSSLNYGNVLHSGLDISITHFINKKIILDANFALFNSTDYYNTLTKQYDPINAPKFKLNASLKWDAPFADIMFSYRFVDEFEWQDGIWKGIIGPYNIFDLHINKKITDNLSFSVSGMNIFNDVHRELIGGAKLGRQIVMRMTSSF